MLEGLGEDDSVGGVGTPGEAEKQQEEQFQE